MAVRVYLRSPVALAWTLLGGLAVGAVSAVGWLVATTLRARAGVAGPLFLGGLGELLYLLVLFALFAALAVVWLPFSAGVVHAVGRTVRGHPPSLRTSATAVLDSLGSLTRWLKTRAAVPGVADRLLGADDVAPSEVVSGCEPFVVPALVLDAPDALEVAVERANRMTPEPGRERLSLGCLGATALAAGGAYLGSAVVVGPLTAAGAPLAAGLLVVGLVLTAALDAAWRAERYASRDLSEGFVRG